ncbi:dephospho-CoA kinase [Bacteroidota bacterium]
MLQIGITGGIGSGKSIVCEVFKSLGVPVYHSDERAKFFINSDTQIICKIKNCFGNNIYWQDNKIDRHALAKIVFNNKESLELLNSIIHPIVNEDYQSWINKQNQAKYILKEAAIIFESDTYKNLNYIICVSAPEKLRIERVITVLKKKLKKEY